MAKYILVIDHYRSKRSMPSADYTKHTPFVFAVPVQYDTTIDIFTAYKYYIASEPWAADNYLRDPSRKPHWL